MIVQVKHSGWVHLKTGQCMYTTARFLFLVIMFLFSKSVSYLFLFCGCVFVQLWISYSLHSSAAWLAAAFWATALWSNDHCLGDLCFLPKLQAPTRHLDKCQSSISVFVYFVFLLPVPPIPNAARSTATKGGRFCVFLLFSKLLSKHKTQNYKRFHNDFCPTIYPNQVRLGALEFPKGKRSLDKSTEIYWNLGKSRNSPVHTQTRAMQNVDANMITSTTMTVVFTIFVIISTSLCSDHGVRSWNHICWWPVVTNHKPTGRLSTPPANQA